MKKRIAKFLAVIIVLAAVIGLSGSVVITRENEYKLIRQFGRVERIIDTAGISFKVPFVQTADSLPREILLYDLAPSDVITMDKKTMLTGSAEIRPDAEFFRDQCGAQNRRRSL